MSDIKPSDIRITVGSNPSDPSVIEAILFTPEQIADLLILQAVAQLPKGKRIQQVRFVVNNHNGIWHNGKRPRDQLVRVEVVLENIPKPKRPGKKVAI